MANQDIRQLGTEEILGQVDALKHQLQEMRFRLTSGTPLSVPLTEFKELRKEVARCLTEVRNRELQEDGAADNRDRMRARRARVKKIKQRIARKALRAKKR